MALCRYHEQSARTHRKRPWEGYHLDILLWSLWLVAQVPRTPTLA